MTRLSATLTMCSALASAQTLPVDRPELRGAILGRVCRDLNADGHCGDDEPGLENVRVVLETGQAAITDSAGRFHLSAVAAREPDLEAGGRLQPGRHLLKLDPRGLPPKTELSPKRAWIELPMGGVATQDFAVVFPLETARLVSPLPTPPAGGRIEGARLRYVATGNVSPGDSVRVNGEPATVDPTGAFRAPVTLVEGSTALSISDETPGGTLRLFRQVLDAVHRPSSWMVVPHAPELVSTLALPASSAEPAAAGHGVVRVQAVPGTIVELDGRRVTVGASGRTELTHELLPGKNELKLTFVSPAGERREEPIALVAESKPLVVGLLDLEATWSTRDFQPRLFGRGAVHVEHGFGAWKLSGELELRDTDLDALRTAGQSAAAAGQSSIVASLLALAAPRSPEHLERALDPLRFPTEWGDQSVAVVPNSAEGRLRIELSNESVGAVGFGTHRADVSDAELGRFERDLFGAYASLHAAPGPAQLRLDLFAAPAAVDPLKGLATVPAHDELTATGGSVYELGGSTAVAEGSEVVRVEVRDPLTRAALAEVHLVRGRDYEINAAAGRIVLARPLSFIAGEAVLGSDPLVSAPLNVLVVDYQRLALDVAGRQTVGGNGSVELGPLRLSLAGARERVTGGSGFGFLRATARLSLGKITGIVEAAQSSGQAIAREDFGRSDDGGLFYARPIASPVASSGQALLIRLKGPGLGDRGEIDATYRFRSAGFSDQEHEDSLLFRQLSLRVRQPLGPVVVGLIGDQQSGADPRDPFSQLAFASRTVGGSIGFAASSFEVRLEGKDTQLTASPDLISDPQTGARTSAGVFARYRLLPNLWLVAAHQQALSMRGTGPGAFDNTFSALGADVEVSNRTQLGARAGWGPSFGPLAWLEARHRSGADSFFGTYSVDVDGPDVGRAKSVTGARTEIGDGSAVFVEDITAHDANSIRLSRAIGLDESLGALRLAFRYERGARSPIDALPPLQRDAAGLTATWVRDRLSLFGRGELRWDRGNASLGPPVTIDRIQRLGSAAASLELTSALHALARASYSDTRNAGALETRFLEGTAGLSLRGGWGIALLRYAVDDELLPPSRAMPETLLHSISLLPSFHAGPRFDVAAGAHLGWSTQLGSTAMLVSASLRPTFRVIDSIEIGLEGAIRSAALDGGQLTAARAEVGYRASDAAMIALGYTLFGFSGDGLSRDPKQSQDRVYVRAELAY